LPSTFTFFGEFRGFQNAFNSKHPNVTVWHKMFQTIKRVCILLALKS